MLSPPNIRTARVIKSTMAQITNKSKKNIALVARTNKQLTAPIRNDHKIIFFSIFIYIIFCSIYNNARGADFRHTSHGSPQATPIYGKAAPVWVAVPIIGVCSFSRGDCETIEQYVLHSCRMCCKVTTFFLTRKRYLKELFLCKHYFVIGGIA